MSGGSKARETQIAKYGGEEGYRIEMRRRRTMVKNHPGGSFRTDKEFAKQMSKKGHERRWHGKTND